MFHPDWSQDLENYRPSQLVLGFSGGRDSVALLDILQREALPAPLLVVYIDHGWHPEAAAWGEFCRQHAQSYGVEFKEIKVQCKKNEAAARIARYAALEALLPPRGILLTAHHADDQIESFFLNMLRGAGLEGLSAMPFRKPFGAGEHWRPLLQTRRSTINDYVQAQNLSYLNDPSNDNPRYFRHRLRQFLPHFEALQTHAGRNLLRSIQHLQAARATQEALWQTHFQNPQYFNWRRWQKEKGDFLATQALRHQLLLWGFNIPEKRFNTFVRGLQNPQSQAMVNDGGKRVQSYRGVITVLDDSPLSSPPAVAAESYWEGVGQISIQGLDDFSDCQWTLYPVAARFRPQGSRYSMHLKTYFQRRGIGPKQRRRLPILCRGEDVLWINHENSIFYPQLRVEIS